MRPPQLLELLLAVVLAAPAAGYATLFNAPTAKGVSPFSAAGLATHSTGILDEQQQCPAAPDLPTRLDIAAPERALPKRAAPTEGGDGPTKDPLGLWAPPPPSGPKGPSVFKLNQVRRHPLALRRPHAPPCCSVSTTASSSSALVCSCCAPSHAARC